MPDTYQDRAQTDSQEAFHAARRRALVQAVLAELSGRSDDLLSLDQVREKLRLNEPAKDVKLQEIPLNRIVGSAGRYRDFNRAFLPRAPINADRWSRIEKLAGQGKLPPINVFQVGDAYFVLDGHHRVSVARARQQGSIWAHVVEIPVRVPLGPDTSPEDLLLKSEYAEFLERTGLDRNRPDQRIELTSSGGYLSLLRHIEVHQFYMGLRSRHYPGLAEAAANWYDQVYQPVGEQIRASGMLGQFPRRTEADLYLWIAENRARLQMRYGQHPEAQEAVEDFAQDQRIAALPRHMRRLLHWLFPRLALPEPQRRVPARQNHTPDGRADLPEGDSMAPE